MHHRSWKNAISSIGEKNAPSDQRSRFEEKNTEQPSLNRWMTQALTRRSIMYGQDRHLSRLGEIIYTATERKKKMAVSSREKLPRSDVSFAEGDRSILAVSQSKPTPSKLECKSFQMLYRAGIIQRTYRYGGINSPGALLRYKRCQNTKERHRFKPGYMKPIIAATAVGDEDGETLLITTC